MLNTYRSLIGADPDEYAIGAHDDGRRHTAPTAAGNTDVQAFSMATSW
ncbi:MAG: hypothetical protein R2932_43680 [Caldilineaceae bacterium]